VIRNFSNKFLDFKNWFILGVKTFILKVRSENQIFALKYSFLD